MSTPTSISSQIHHVPPKTTRPQNDLEVAYKSVSQDHKAILKVIDAAFDGSRPQVRAEFSFGDNIEDGMRSLPIHEAGTARILDVTVHSDFVITGLRDTKGPERTRSARTALMRYLQNTYTQPLEERRIFRWLNDPLLVNDIGSISSQWSQRLGGDREDHTRDGEDHPQLYRLVNRTSLQQHPMDFDVRPRDSYLTCAHDSNNRLIVIIVHDVWSKQPFRTNKTPDDYITFKNPRSTTNMLDGTSWISLSDGTLETFAKLLVLDFLLASIYLQRVDYYGALIYPKVPEKAAWNFSLTSNPHLQVPLGLFEPRLSATSKEAFQEIEDAEGILRNVVNLVDSINFVIAALKPDEEPATQQPAYEERERRLPLTGKSYIDGERRLQHLERLCTERCDNADRALNALNRQLDYLTKRHAIREAKSIKTLTILASLYLPLSLSASLLSMSAPFKKVAHTMTKQDPEVEEDQRILGTNLLFDFVGMFVTLAAITIFIVQAIRLGMWFKSDGLGLISKKFTGPFSIFYYGRRWHYGGKGGKIFDLIRVLTAWWIGAGLLITLLTIFLVGMLRTGQKAWDTAWIMFAVYCSVGGALIISYFGAYWLLYRQKIHAH
ncbi:hypothetical protein FALBO_12291 [Fusarium albosuccineum]|uniref:Uncharacterized protein n=1 Tax=Fusarium albosuccineum TaxID=1237068 RepID=A0A8H4P840_9HYPO|nr:hypothetical protein FALBO_12291 [Fusarium albosuccineum]